MVHTLNKKAVLEIHKKVFLIRQTEELIAKYYHHQKMRCPVHLSIGQEAVPSVLSYFINNHDLAVSTHRGHAHYIAKNGNLKRLQWLEKRGAKFQEQNSSGMTAFDYAVVNGNEDCMQFLMKFFSKDVQSILIARQLCAIAKELKQQQPSRDTPFLHFFLEKQPDNALLAELLNYCDTNERDGDGKTLLHLAVLSGNNVLLQKILDNPFTDLTACCKLGRSALHYGCIKNDVEAVLNISSACSSREVNLFKRRCKWNFFPLHYAVMQNNETLVYHFLNYIHAYDEDDIGDVFLDTPSVGHRMQNLLFRFRLVKFRRTSIYN